ncbi:MAG TPA: hypothetical protein VJP86_11995 [Vicinamibacterales bacterium]|jgi:hypothetical protein|nr:hypothetical protein [Vicinamibacterales bacterium]
MEATLSLYLFVAGLVVPPAVVVTFLLLMAVPGKKTSADTHETAPRAAA